MTNVNPPAPAPKKKRSKAILWIVLGVIVLVVVGCSMSGGKAAPATPTFAPTTAAPVVPVPPPAAPAVTQAPAPVVPAVTTSQKNAVDKAVSYLGYAAFSKTGLVKQLEYEGFSAADSKYAVDHITVDWTEQADKKAASYMSYSSFSKSGLISQLKFEGFTQAEAAHGAASVGL